MLDGGRYLVKQHVTPAIDANQVRIGDPDDVDPCCLQLL